MDFSSPTADALFIILPHHPLPLLFISAFYYTQFYWEISPICRHVVLLRFADGFLFSLSIKQTNHEASNNNKLEIVSIALFCVATREFPSSDSDKTFAMEVLRIVVEFCHREIIWEKMVWVQILQNYELKLSVIFYTLALFFIFKLNFYQAILLLNLFLSCYTIHTPSTTWINFFRIWFTFYLFLKDFFAVSSSLNFLSRIRYESPYRIVFHAFHSSVFFFCQIRDRPLKAFMWTICNRSF